ncbi:MAG TPA: TetR family transcriptional regulator [Pseudonocardia sp.]|jgi:AcrR family transcriptional regulator|uniref:TetR family transcriptional regulator n=1 Tax=Pseudonocardia sp. TaxID=60912 RepID=UPI002BF8A6D1|nr:TetR family transcriptional regulator [Pseudonocardia sp.]HTF54340.1 TetR family transcriptional regulator [Pseudonocardia sp.]
MVSLRERKKARTRADLQRHALRLFRAQGYAATTVDQIAGAAEVSRATFFRYFPSKEDVVRYDDVDPLMAASLDAQPPGTPLLPALRAALRSAFDQLEPEKRELEEVRMEISRTEPELRDRHRLTVAEIAGQLAGRIGRDPAEFDVQLLAGVLLGARLAAQSIADQAEELNYLDTLDAVLARLQDGVPLTAEPLINQG